MTSQDLSFPDLSKNLPNLINQDSSEFRSEKNFQHIEIIDCLSDSQNF